MIPVAEVFGWLLICVVAAGSLWLVAVALGPAKGDLPETLDEHRARQAETYNRDEAARAETERMARLARERLAEASERKRDTTTNRRTA